MAALLLLGRNAAVIMPLNLHSALYRRPINP